jgi:hypothetical protein
VPSGLQVWDMRQQAGGLLGSTLGQQNVSFEQHESGKPSCEKRRPLLNVLVQTFPLQHNAQTEKASVVAAQYGVAPGKADAS